MSVITVLDSEYATLLYHPEHKIVHHIFRQQIGGQPFQDILNRGTDLMREHQADKWLSDDRKNIELLPEDNEWGVTVWFNATKAAGWKYWALVVPESVAGKMSMIDAVHRFTEAGVRTHLFTDPDKALAWLESI